jgi:D-methionine transport system substrate-binding protein
MSFTRKKTMLVLIVVLVLLAGMCLVGCTKPAEEPADDVVPTETVKLVVGATAVPHGEILANLQESLKADGVELEIKEYSDYVLPNTALDEGEIDANFFQHVPYLEDFNEKNGTDLLSVAVVHFEPLGVYPGKSDSLDNIKDGAKIAVDNDATNEARSLQLLQAKGLITLKDGVGLEATPKDVVDNPHKIKFVEAEAPNLPRLLKDVDFAVINGNFALSADLDPKTVLASEDPNSEAAQTYANVLVVKSGRETDIAIQKLAAALTAEVTRSFIEKTWPNAVVPVF